MRVMRLLKLLFFSLIAVCASAQQKTYDWVAQNPDSFRIGPGFHSGIAVYNPHGWEAIHVRLDIAARQPVSVGVVRQEDWNNAVHNPEQLEKLDYACLTEGVTSINYSCNFYASYTSRVVVVRDTRQSERPVVTLPLGLHQQLRPARPPAVCLGESAQGEIRDHAGFQVLWAVHPGAR